MFPQGPTFKKLELSNKLDPKLTNEIIKKEFYAFILKFILSLILVGAGIYFIIVGLNTDGKIELEILSLHLSMNKIVPGILYTILGVALMLFSRINIKVK